MQGLDIGYMLGLVPVILGYVPLTLAMASAAMVCALVLVAVEVESSRGETARTGAYEDDPRTARS